MACRCSFSIEEDGKDVEKHREVIKPTKKTAGSHVASYRFNNGPDIFGTGYTHYSCVRLVSSDMVVR